MSVLIVYAIGFVVFWFIAAVFASRFPHFVKSEEREVLLLGVFSWPVTVPIFLLMMLASVLEKLFKYTIKIFSAKKAESK